MVMTESNRREFLVATAAVGGGMALSLYLPEVHAEDQVVGAQVNARPWLPPENGGVEVNPWIVIGPDDRVLIRVNQSELGQGVLTSNPMMICEELECDWSKVQAVYADPNRHVR
jgi:isoquinoline 1-oxidoreductase beta subunit